MKKKQHFNRNVSASDSGTDLLPCAVSSYAIIFCFQLKQTSFRSPPAPYTAPAGKGARMQFRVNAVGEGRCGRSPTSRRCHRPHHPHRRASPRLLADGGRFSAPLPEISPCFR
ncbi:AGAP000772-PA [Anopheles gambiae str. PEST]|uniref:AGAP000772-PA n=1 Tax=Anopheles gambiae TaxID=7165 RepID=Q5TUQ4_ANOGA|nr:AGAP000772-PA [Anopheles gambiae str. PEST]